MIELYYVSLEATFFNPWLAAAETEQEAEGIAIDTLLEQFCADDRDWAEVPDELTIPEWAMVRIHESQMIVRKNGEPHRIYTRNGGPYLSAIAGASSRLPSGHPEAFFEAFANIYATAYDAMVKRAANEKFETVNTIYPNIYDGVEGMLFITRCVESSKHNGGWVPFRHPKSRK